MPTTPRLLLALALPLALVLGACSGSGASTAPSAAAPTAAPPSAAPSEAAPSEPAAASGTIALADSALGKIIVDAEGRTLYGFKADTVGISTCYDKCATNWPPLLATGDATVGAGLDAAKLTTVDRTDGTKQVKYGDWPLYYFAADAAAGDTNGQKVGDVWFVVGADGALIGG